jgi:single-strand DNA-binding protein
MNKVILMGRITKDLELKYTQSNKAVCKFTIAVDRRFTSQSDGKVTDYFNIVVWNKTAEFCSKYFAKGLRVAVIGTIQNRSWDDSDGNKKYVTEIIADEAYFADTKKQWDTNSDADDCETVSVDDLPF